MRKEKWDLSADFYEWERSPGCNFRSLATLLFSNHHPDPSSWQHQLTSNICALYAFQLTRTCCTSRTSVHLRHTHIHAFLNIVKGVWEWVTVRNYYLQADTTKHPATLSSVWRRRCQHSSSSLFLASFIMHNWKSPPQSTWSMFTKPNGTMLITKQ